MKITMYSTDCPRCKVLEAKLQQHNISDYNIVTDKEIMLSKGIDTVPVLEIDGKLFDFKEAVDWINGR